MRLRRRRPSGPDPYPLISLRTRLLAEHGIALVVDVGAEAGEWAAGVRRLGYGGRLLSVEPVAASFAALERHAAPDPAWSCARAALGAEDGSASINLSRNRHSSSLLPMLPRHLEHAPNSVVEGSEEVPVRRLDGLLAELAGDVRPLLLKLDTQGSELEVLRGGRRALEAATLVEIELSLVELYAGQPLLPEVFERLGAAGFECVALAPVFVTTEGRMLQVDGLFERRPA